MILGLILQEVYMSRNCSSDVLGLLISSKGFGASDLLTMPRFLETQSFHLDYV